MSQNPTPRKCRGHKGVKAIFAKESEGNKCIVCGGVILKENNDKT